MPFTVRKFNAQVKDPTSGNMIPAGLLSSDSLQAIETAETAAVAAVQQKGVETVASIPNDYTTLSGDVDDLKTQLDAVSESIGGETTEIDINSANLWEQGYRAANTGFKGNDAKAIRTTGIIPNDIKISVDSDYMYAVSAYDSDSDFTSIHYMGILGSNYTFSKPSQLTFLTGTLDIAQLHEDTGYYFFIILYDSTKQIDLSPSTDYAKIHFWRTSASGYNFVLATDYSADKAEIDGAIDDLEADASTLTTRVDNLVKNGYAWGTQPQSECTYIGKYYFDTTGGITANNIYLAYVFEAQADGELYVSPQGNDTVHVGVYSEATYSEGSFSGTLIGERVTNPVDKTSAVKFKAGNIIGIDYSITTPNKTINILEPYLTAEKVQEIEDELETLNPLKKTKQYIHIADSYPVYVGDTLEIFYKGIFALFNPYEYAVKITCSVGHSLDKKYYFEPSASHAGNSYPITIGLYDNNSNLIESASSTINVVVPQNPATSTNILTIGDSMTAGGQWVTEVKSMMTAMNLSNYNFIGLFGSVAGAKYQAIGGYNYTRYNNEYITDNWVWIDCAHDKTSDDVGSVYKDANNNPWRIVLIEPNKIKLYSNTGATSAPIPASGTLTYLQGGTQGSVHTTSITYTTTSTSASGNPLWNESEGKVDIKWYVETICGASGIDYAIIFLGWNDEYKDLQHEDWFKGRVNTMITNIRTAYPDCTILLCGVQMPSADGMGFVYGTSPAYYSLVDWVLLGHQKWLQEIAEDDGNAYFVDISAQFDTEHDYNTEEKYVNKRSTIKEAYQIDPVHPATSGYLQFGDAIYRKLLEIDDN